MILIYNYSLSSLETISYLSKTSEKNTLLSSVSREASGENGQNDGGLVRLAGHKEILQKRGERAGEAGQKIPAQVLTVCKGKGIERKEAFRMT